MILQNDKDLVLSRIAIILVNYNGYKDTIECLKSINELNFSNCFTYVVDNGSTDDSYAVLENYRKEHKLESVTIVKSEDNLGFAGGNNVGIKIALQECADYILMLNNDTIVTPEFLKSLVSAADEKTIVTPRIMYWKDKDLIWYAGGRLSFRLGRAWHNRIHKKYDASIDDKNSQVTFISGCCMLIHKSIFQKVGLLKEEFFLYYEDTEFCWRALNCGVKMEYIGNSVIYHNVSSSTGHDSSLMNYYKIRNRFFLIEEYVRGMNKPIAYIYSFMEMLVGIIIGKYQVRAVYQGIRDFKTGVKGKRRESSI